MSLELKKSAIPAAPSILPAGLKAEWAKRYAAAFEEAARDENNNESACHGAALRDANRLLRVDKPASYEDAVKIPRWQIHGEAIERDNKLCFVTIDGRKYSFPTPAGKRQEQSQGQQQSNGGQQQPPAK